MDHPCREERVKSRNEDLNTEPRIVQSSQARAPYCSITECKTVALIILPTRWCSIFLSSKPSPQSLATRGSSNNLDLRFARTKAQTTDTPKHHSGVSNETVIVGMVQTR